MNIYKLKSKFRNYRTNKSLTLKEAMQIMNTNKSTILIDVRSQQEYREYHIDGAICIPHFEIQNKIEQFVKNKNALIILYCQSGIRSKSAIEILERKGYNNVYHIKNGLDG